MTDRDEMLMQRCVDGESTPQERRELMERLDHASDGWKQLACSFMEEQLFANAVCDDEVRSVTHPESSEKLQQQRHWFHHPMMSLALSVCVAFMAGLLVRGQLAAPIAPVVADANAGVEEAAKETDSSARIVPTKKVPDAAAGLVSDEGVYKVRLMENGEAFGELPVYSLKDYVRQSQEYWQNSERFGGDSGDGQPRVKTIWLSAPDGHTYIIPVEEFTSPWFQ